VGITTVSSREFNQDAGRAKRAAQKGPVFITDRGRPAHVLLSIEEYRRLAGAGRSLLEAIADDGDGGDFDFDPPKLEGPIGRPADLS
jgi:prevent-host-death family protein